MPRPEGEEGGGDEHPQQEDIHEGEARAVQAEEEPRPHAVQGQLDEEEPECHGGARESVPPPDEPGRHGHGEVQRGPHGTEDPAGGIPGRLAQLEVPVARLEQAAHGGRQEARHDPTQEPAPRPEGFHPRPPSEPQGQAAQAAVHLSVLRHLQGYHPVAEAGQGVLRAWKTRGQENPVVDADAVPRILLALRNVNDLEPPELLPRREGWDAQEASLPEVPDPALEVQDPWNAPDVHRDARVPFPGEDVGELPARRLRWSGPRSR